MVPMPGFRPWVLLLVDDEPDILSSMKTLLESSIDGLKVITAPSGRVGLDLLERERVDLIVSDFKMPGMDGIEFLYQSRRHFPNIPRVMLTAFGNEDLARRAVVDAFAGAFLSKGAEPEAIVSGISQLLDYKPSSAPPPAPVPEGSLLPPTKDKPGGRPPLFKPKEPKAKGTPAQDDALDPPPA